MELGTWGLGWMCSAGRCRNKSSKANKTAPFTKSILSYSLTDAHLTQTNNTHIEKHTHKYKYKDNDTTKTLSKQIEHHQSSQKRRLKHGVQQQKTLQTSHTTHTDRACDPCVCMCICVCMYVCMCVCFIVFVGVVYPWPPPSRSWQAEHIHIHIHTYRHTHIHIYTHTHTQLTQLSSPLHTHASASSHTAPTPARHRHNTDTEYRQTQNTDTEYRHDTSRVTSRHTVYCRLTWRVRCRRRVITSFVNSLTYTTHTETHTDRTQDTGN